MPAWVKDDDVWAKAKKAVQPKWGDYEEPYAVVSHVYKKMGGKVEAGQGPKELTPSMISTIDKIFGKFYKKEEANTSTGTGALMRTGSNRKWTESYKTFARFSEASVSVDRKKREIRCVIISEGPGNQRDRNYYTPEAIAGAVDVFSGKRSYINHQTEQQRQERPEGDIRNLCGFWKNTKLVNVVNETGKTVPAVAGTLICDKSDAGDEALAKAEASIEYNKIFPISQEVYAGISINADGVSEGEIEINGETWNKIARIVNADSADVVTRPARGGAFLALNESMAKGTKINQKGVRNMKLKEASAIAEQIAGCAKRLMEETDSKKKEEIEAEIDELEKKAKALGAEAEDEDEGEKKEGEKKEDEGEKKKDKQDDSSKDDAKDDGKDGKDGKDSKDADGSADKDSEDTTEEEVEAETMKGMKELMPQMDDEEEATYEARVKNAVKLARTAKKEKEAEGDEKKAKASESVKEFMKVYPKRYNAIVAHVREVFKAEKQDFKSLKEQILSLRAEKILLEDRAFAKNLLETAKIPDRILSIADLEGLDRKEAGRMVDKFKGLLEGNTDNLGNPVKGASASVKVIESEEYSKHGIPTV